eukprot:3457440-Pyramimonas_sp.AAC.1
MRPSHPFRHTLIRFVAQRGAPPKVPVAQIARVLAIHFGTSSHASWPHGELHLRSQWRSSHASRPVMSPHPHKFRGPIKWSST